MIKEIFIYKKYIFLGMEMKTDSPQIILRAFKMNLKFVICLKHDSCSIL
jgi:hypothetical protein